MLSNKEVCSKTGVAYSALDEFSVGLKPEENLTPENIGQYEETKGAFELLGSEVNDLRSVVNIWKYMQSDQI